MRTKPQSSQRKMLWAGMLITLTIIILFGCSQKAFAQPWSTSGNDISNSNTGNVGVGTTSPGVKLDILSSVNLIARFGSTAGAHSQVLIDAPATFNSNLTLQRGGVSKWYLGNRASNDRLSFIESTGAVETLTLLQNGNVGIGTPTPSYKLDVLNGYFHTTYNTQAHPPSSIFGGLAIGWNRHAGNAEVNFYNVYDNAAISYQFSQKTGASTATDLMTIMGNGNVGIGTTSPSSILHIVKSQNNPSVVELDNTTDGASSRSIYFLKYTGQRSGGLQYAAPSFTLGAGYELVRPDALTLYTNPGATGGISFVSSNASAPMTFGVGGYGTPAERIRITSSGNVGIGTASPGQKLSVAGAVESTSGGFKFPDGTTQTTAASGSSQWASGTNNISFSAGNVGIGTSTPDATLGVSSNIGDGYYAASISNANIYGYGMRINTAHGSSDTTRPTLSVENNGVPILQVLGAGPTSLFGNGDQYAAFIKNTGTYGFGLRITSGLSTNGRTALLVENASSTSLLQVQNNGNVGIGTIAPGYRLDVQTGQINSSGGLCIAGDCKTSWSQVGGSQWTTASSSIYYNTGNVGIGNGSPTEKLQVTGNGKFSGNLTVDGTVEGGNIKAKYQDVAEWVESSQELSAGTLVVLDHTKSNQVIASSQAYDTRVAGVISAQPGIALGEPGDHKVLVATTGRVRLMVDASKGPIQIGDLLVTSDIPGVAMKSEAINVGGVQIHRPGTLIGKALEPLARGRGEILVLLSLQ